MLRKLTYSDGVSNFIVDTDVRAIRQMIVCDIAFYMITGERAYLRVASNEGDIEFFHWICEKFAL